MTCLRLGKLYFIIHLCGLNLDLAEGEFTACFPPRKEMVRKPLGQEDKPEGN